MGRTFLRSKMHPFVTLVETMLQGWGNANQAQECILVPTLESLLKKNKQLIIQMDLNDNKVKGE